MATSQKTAIPWEWCIDTLEREAEDIFKDLQKASTRCPRNNGKEKQKLDTNHEHQGKVKVYRSWSMPNFLPVFPDGEGKETMKPFSVVETKVKKFKRKKRYCYY